MPERRIKELFDAIKPSQALLLRTERRANQMTKEKRRAMAVHSVVLVTVISVLLVGTALAAAAHFDIFNYFAGKDQPIAPLEEAAALVQTDLGHAERDGYRIECKEAVYVGRNILLLVDVSAPEGRDCGGVNVSLPGSDPMGIEPIRDVKIESVASYTPAPQELPEGVSHRAYEEFLLSDAGEIPDALWVTLSTVINETDAESSGNEADASDDDELALTVCLRRTQDARTAPFIADADAAQAANMEILDMRAEYTDFEAVLTIRYALAGQENRAALYGTARGIFYHTDEHCSGMRNAVALTPEELDGKKPCPVCVSSDASTSGCELLQERRVRFHPTDAAGNGIAVSSRKDYACSVDGDGRIVRCQVLCMQTAQMIPAELLLQVEEGINSPDFSAGTAAGQFPNAPIPCVRQAEIAD